LVVCAFLIWRVVERLSSSVEVIGVVPIVVGLIGALANWGVARVLREASKEDAAIRLAYVHNVGDTLGFAHSGSSWKFGIYLGKFSF
jgi:cobalt-zinc-cadmium efflux system protein